MDLAKMFLCITGILFFSGCALLENPAVRIPAFYDLDAGKTETVSSVPVTFRNFADISGNGIRMVRRLSNGQITFDDLNRFSAPPSQLIRRRLTELFPAAAENGQAVRISGTLIRLEADCSKKEALMEIDYTLEYKGCKRALRHRIREKITSCSGKEIAAAFEACVNTSGRRLGSAAGAFKAGQDKIKVKK